MTDITVLKKHANTWQKAVKTIDAEIPAFEKAESHYKSICRELQSGSLNCSKIRELCGALQSENNSSSYNLTSAIESFIRTLKWACDNGLSEFVKQINSSEESDEINVIIRSRVIKWKKSYDFLETEIVEYKRAAQIFTDLCRLFLVSPVDLSTMMELNQSLQEECEGYRIVNEKLVTHVNSFTSIIKNVGSDHQSMKNFTAMLKKEGLLGRIKEFESNDINRIPSIKITFIAFCSKQNGEESSLGEPIYDDMHYLVPMLSFDSLVQTSRKTLLRVKIYNPDNTLRIASDSSFSFEEEIDNPGGLRADNAVELSGLGNTTGTSYPAGVYRYEVWEQEVLLIKENINVLERKPVVSAPKFRITNIEFANVDHENTILTGFGAQLYNNTQYLKPRISINSSAGSSELVTVYLKIYSPTGKLSNGTSSPTGYTTSENITLGYTTWNMSGWGSKSGTTYSETGTWVFEVWSSDNNLLIKKSFVIHPKKIVAPTFKITKVEFANVDYDNKIITPFGSVLYNTVKYLQPRIHIEKTGGDNLPVTIYKKIYNPSGVLQRGTDSPSGYTHKEEITLNQTTCLLTAWGNNEGTYYSVTGSWRVEFWYDGKLLYTTSVFIKRVKKSNGCLFGFIFFLLIGAWLGYQYGYLPHKKDKEAPRTYVYATNLFLRSGKVADVEYNRIGKIPYGSELLTYSQDGQGWAEVKYDGHTGYVSSDFILNSEDFHLLNGVWGSADVKDAIPTSKCRLAILNYLKSQNMQTGNTGWQIYTFDPEVKPNNILYPKLSNGYNKFTSFAFIIKNNATSERKLVLYSFTDDEIPVLSYDEDAPKEGEIKNITYWKGNYRVIYTKGAGSRPVTVAKQVAEPMQQIQKVTDISTETNRQMATEEVAIEIKDVYFKNVDDKGNKLGNVGEKIYSDWQFLTPGIRYDNLGEEGKAITLQFKILDPSGNLLQGAKSPSGYTYEIKTQIEGGYKKNKIFSLYGWGNSNGNYYVPGKYTYQIWCNGKMLYNSLLIVESR